MVEKNLDVTETPANPSGRSRRSALTALIVAALVALNILVVKVYPPIAPQISVVPESVLVEIVDGEPVVRPWFTLPLVGPIYLTNTLTAVFFVFVLLLILAVAVRRSLKRSGLHPSGLALYLEVILDMAGGMVKNAIDPAWRDRILPFYFTFFIYILLANTTKILPFFETLGLAVPVNGGVAAKRWAPGFLALTNRTVPAGTQGYELIGFFRGASTSLNFTLSLAIGSVLMIQIFGVRANGWRYFTKFLPLEYFVGFGRFILANFRLGRARRIAVRREKGEQDAGAEWLAKFDAEAARRDIADFRRKSGGFFIDTFVGILEFVSEAAKILSFAFRLFGNMFAGSVLLLFLGYMAPVFLTSFLQLYELIFGLIQAFVFSMLTAIFMNMAVRHGHE